MAARERGAAGGEKAPQPPVLLRAARLLDVDKGEIVEPGQVLVVGEHIAEVRPTRLPEGSSILNVLPARIAGLREDGGDTVLLKLELADETGGAGEGAGPPAALLARITRRSRDQLGLAEGQAVYAQVKGVALMR